VHARVADADGARGGLYTLVLNGKRIEHIAQGELPVPAGAEVIDVAGRWVAPGLIDAHTHITTVAAARKVLASGVTTVRSASTPAYQDVGLRALERAGGIVLPDVYAAGVFVSPDLGETILADPKLANLVGGVRSDEELRELVDVNADHGVDWIKTRGTERAGLPDTDPRKQVYTEHQLRTIVEAAKARGLSVEVHAHGDEGAYAAVRAGARSIEHGTFLSDSTLRLMLQQGVYFVPTYTTVEDLGTPGGDYDDPVLTVRSRFMLPRLRDAIRRAHRMGVKLVTGVDTDYGPRSTSRVSHEVERFVELGLSAKEALAAATTTPAEMLGIADRVGRVKEGYEADLIVVDGNPLEDVRALQDVLVVIADGRVGVRRTPFGLAP
jgi:imidazolonepropionase-like amidohydrolase